MLSSTPPAIRPYVIVQPERFDYMKDPSCSDGEMSTPAEGSQALFRQKATMQPPTLILWQGARWCLTRLWVAGGTTRLCTEPIKAAT